MNLRVISQQSGAVLSVSSLQRWLPLWLLLLFGIGFFSPSHASSEWVQQVETLASEIAKTIPQGPLYIDEVQDGSGERIYLPFSKEIRRTLIVM